MHKFLERYFSFVISCRWWVIAVTTLMMVAVAFGASRLKIANDFRELLGEENPQLAALEILENTYSASNSVIIAIIPDGGSVFTREALGEMEAFTEAAWGTPFSLRVDSLTNYSHTIVEGEDLIVAPLVEGASELSDEDIERIKNIALNEPELVNRLVSDEGHIGALVISFVKADDNNSMVTQVPNYLNEIMEMARERNPNYEYRMTGDLILNRSVADALEEGIQSTLPIAFVLVLFGTIILLRSFFGVIIVIIITIFGVITTMGFAGWVGFMFSPLTAGVPVIVMVLAVAHSIHIISATLVGLQQGKNKKTATADSLRINVWPVFLTSVTTIVGFLSLNSSDSPPIQVTGNLAAFGMLSIFFYSMTLLPALISVMPWKQRQNYYENQKPFEYFGGFVVKNRKILLLIMTIIAVVLTLGVSRNEFSDDWTKQFDERYQFRLDTDYIAANLTGLNALEYSLNSGEEGGITNPEYLNKLDQFAEWFRSQPEVTHVSAFSDIMKRLNRTMNGDTPDQYKLPDDPMLAAQYLLLYEFSLPFGSDLNDQIDIARSATRMRVSLANIPVIGIRALDDRAKMWLDNNTPEFSQGATGLTMIFAHLTQRNIESMLLGTVIGMGLISLILIFVFRSLKHGLISLIPNFIPPILGFGLWGYLVGQVSFSAAITAVIAFGIIVDDTIHFMTKYLKDRREGQDANKSVIYAFRTVGHALFTTSAVLGVGFATFAFAGFEGVWVTGLMVMIMVFFGIIVDFLLLPPLLIALDKRKL